MARYIGPVCRLCRREDMKLFLKGERCYTDKCAIERRPYPPGQHGQGRTKFSEYGIQLREKQKVRRIYGVLERQFRHVLSGRGRREGRHRREPAPLLERRLDNVVYRLGFADIAQRGAPAGPPRALPGQRPQGEHPVVPRAAAATRSRSGSEPRKMARIDEALEAVERRGVPSWLELDKASFTGTVKTMPAREDITLPIQEQLIVEFYSK